MTTFRAFLIVVLLKILGNASAGCFYQPDFQGHVDIPSSDTYINWGAFYTCSSLKSITIPPSVTGIAPYAFQETSLTSIIIPSSVTSIGDFAFFACYSLTSVTLSSGTQISDNAFDRSPCTFYPLCPSKQFQVTSTSNHLEIPNLKCAPCSSNMTYSSDGSLSCENLICPTNTYGVNGVIPCYPCPNGMFSKPNSTACDYGLIITVAGNNNDGYVEPNDNIPAITASLFQPVDVAIDDTTGDVYISDTFNHRIRCVNKVTRYITTIAGVGTKGYLATDDNDLSILAQLNHPSGLIVDSIRRFLYIADQGNQRIRCVNLNTGIITTIAGTGTRGYNASDDGKSASMASLNNPSNLAFDSVENRLFISDRDNRLIRMVKFYSPTNTTITTIAGGGTSLGDGGPANQAQLRSPRGLAYSPNDNSLLIADYLSNRVRKVDLSSGIISTICGNGLASYSGDRNKATGATLNRPWGVAVDANQERAAFFISDRGNNVIRRIDMASGLITTVAGSSISDYSGDMGPAIQATLSENAGICLDNEGMIYIADSNNNRIRKVITTPITPTTPPTMVPTPAGSVAPSPKPSPRPPTFSPTPRPSAIPTASPTPIPTSEPTSQPTSQPSKQPSAYPSRPSSRPTSQPTSQPSRIPTAKPSHIPTLQPSSQPTRQPSAQPSHQPASNPTSQPSRQPTAKPSYRPSLQPTSQPTRQPTARPTLKPSSQPTAQPSRQPVAVPTSRPTYTETTQVSFQVIHTIRDINASIFNVHRAECERIYKQAMIMSLQSGLPNIKESNIAIVDVKDRVVALSINRQLGSIPSSSSSLDITSQIGVVAQDLGFKDGNSAYKALSTQLQTVTSSSGSFSNNLASAASSFPTLSTMFATITSQPVSLSSAMIVTLHSPKPTSHPTSMPSCGDGSFGEPGHCGPCPPGYFSTPGSQRCTACPKGTFTDEFGSKQCTVCPYPSYTTLEGQSKCDGFNLLFGET